MIEQIVKGDEKQKIVRLVLSALPDWFGIAEAREEYIQGSITQICFAAYENEKPIGFLCLKKTGKDTAEIAVMGILKEYHHKGIGTELFLAAKKYLCEKCYSFVQVKTVQMGRYPQYDLTNRFYLSLGFKEFEVFPALWDKWNPCQIYVMSLK